jgi:hypothetical protein
MDQIRLSTAEAAGNLAVIAGRQVDLLNLCREFRVQKLEIFGSVVKGTLRYAAKRPRFSRGVPAAPAGRICERLFWFQKRRWSASLSGLSI